MNSSLTRLLAENWALVLLRGIIAVLFGLLALVWPALTVFTLVVLFGAYAIVEGCLSLIAAFRGTSTAPRWWLALLGIAGLLAGIITFADPRLTTFTLLMFIGAWFLVRGVLEIAGAVHLRRELPDEWLLVLNGIVSALFGLVMLILPGIGAVALAWFIGVTAIIFGALLCGLAFRLRRHHEGELPPAGMARAA